MVRLITSVQAIAFALKALVWCAPDRLQQIIWNLLANAVKFTLNGGITVTLDCTGKSLAIQVRDLGIGINYVFDHFRPCE